jgi:hypothetical protein
MEADLSADTCAAVVGNLARVNAVTLAARRTMLFRKRASPAACRFASLMSASVTATCCAGSRHGRSVGGSLSIWSAWT